MPFHLYSNHLWDELNAHMRDLIHIKIVQMPNKFFVELTLTVNIVL